MKRTLTVVAAVSILASVGLTAAPNPIRATAKVPFSIDAHYSAAFEDYYTTQFPSRWTNQQYGTAWRIGHDAAANWLRDEWARLLRPFAREGAFAELRPFNFVNPTGGDNLDPFGVVGPEANVLAFMPGADPILRKQVVVIGGHYDCVDITVDGGLDCGMQMPVTTAVLEGLARYWIANGIRPRRSVAFFAIDGEEQCLCGSVHYTTLGSPNALFEHLELPPALSVVAYHDTDMIGANYPNRLFGDSRNDFMPMNVFSAPALEDPTRLAGMFASYYAAVANPVFLARFRLYRQAILRQRDRFFADMHRKYPTWTYADGVTKPLFTEDQKKYVNIIDDPLDRSDHTVFIANGIPADINIGFNDPSAAPPGWPSYHHVGESQEEVAYFRSGRMRLNADTLLGYEATAAWIAYMSGAGEDSPVTQPFFIGETLPGTAPPLKGIALGIQNRPLPPMPADQVGLRWMRLGPENRIVRSITLDPTDPDRLYAATQRGGVLASADGGRHWVTRNRGLGPFTSIWNVTVDPDHPGWLYASTHHGGVFRSNDRGRTWVRTIGAARGRLSDVTFAEPTQPFVSSTDVLETNIEIDQTRSEPGGTWLYAFDQCLHQYAPSGQPCSTRADWPPEGYDRYPPRLHYYRYASDAAVMPGGVVVAGGFSASPTPGGIFRSVNRGRTWTFVWPVSEAEERNLWKVVRAGPRRIYASGTDGVFRSDNAGRTWREVGAPTSEVRALAVDPRDPDTVYAGSWDAEGGVFRSTNAGRSWKRITSGLPHRAGIAALAVDPTDPDRLAAATYWYGVYISTDGGQSWRLASKGMPVEVRQRLDDVDFAPGGRLYASSHHGIYLMSVPPGGPRSRA